MIEIGTSPLKIDSDDDGINDLDEDSDEDDLTNGIELMLGTFLYANDSDLDTLNDYEEVKVYATNPLDKDTDKDGVEDAWEVKNGSNCLVAEKSFTIEDSAISGNLLYEATITADADCITTFEMEPKENRLVSSRIAGYISNPVDFNINGTFEKATVKVSFDEKFLEDKSFVPALYYINEESGMFEEVSGVWDGESNYINVELVHFSSYILLNKTEFEEVWNNRIKAAALSESGKNNLNIVFVIDVSASMKSYSRMSVMKSAIVSFLDAMEGDDRAGLVSFASTANVLSKMTNDKDVIKKYVNSLNASGSTAISEGLSEAVSILKEDGADGCDMILLFTDGSDVPPTTYDEYYADIVKYAEESGIIIQTIGTGIVDQSILTRIAEETGGKYYYATETIKIPEEVDKVKQEVEDIKSDSNNDGISDYYTKLLCECKLTTGTGDIVYVNADYDTIQANSDLDGDGIKNGEEYVIKQDSSGMVYVNVITDMDNEDTDYDGLNDGSERKLNTDPTVRNYYITDVDRMMLDTRYMSSLISQEFLDSKWFRFQICAGNAIINNKISLKKDYKRALLEFISIYSEGTLQNSITSYMIDAYESDLVETGNNIIKIISICKNQCIDCGELIEIMNNINDNIDMLNKLRNNMTDVDTVFHGVENLYGKLEKLYSRWESREAEILYEIAQDRYDLSQLDYKNVFKININISQKTKNMLKTTGRIAEKVGDVTTVVGGAVDVLKTVNAYSALDAECMQYDAIEKMFCAIAIYSNNAELKEAAYDIRRAIESDKERFLQEVGDVASDIASATTAYAVNQAVDVAMKKFGPLVWAIDAGISLGNMLNGTGPLAEESLRIIALGDTGKAMSAYLKLYVNNGDNSYCTLDEYNGEICLSLLGQLRICGEDAVARGNNESGIVKKGINRIVYGPQSDFEDYLRREIDGIISITSKYRVFLIKKYDGSYLYG